MTPIHVMTGHAAGVSHDQPVQPEQLLLICLVQYVTCMCSCTVCACVHGTSTGSTAGKLPYMRRHGNDLFMKGSQVSVTARGHLVLITELLFCILYILYIEKYISMKQH